MNNNEMVIGTMIVLVLALAAFCFWAYRQHSMLKRYQDREAVWIKRLDAAREMSLVSEITAEQTLELISKTSTLQAWWLPTVDEVVTEYQIQHAPFWIDPHVASMALKTQQPIHQHQMAHSEWAFAYVPKMEEGKIQGLFAIASAPDTQSEDQRLDEKWVEFLMAHWRKSHQSSISQSPH
jgi:hypothetical protein